MRIGKKLTGIYVAAMLLMGSHALAAEPVPMESSSAMAQLERALHAEERSAHYHLGMEAKAAIGEALGQMEMTFVQNPYFLSKGDVRLEITIFQGQPPVVYSLPFYVQETEKAIAVYTRPDKEWVKTVTEHKGDSHHEEREDASLVETGTKYLFGVIKNVETLRSDKKKMVFHVTLDGEAFAKGIRSVMEQGSKTGKPMPELDAALEQWGDFSCELTVDMKAGQVSALHADLTEPCRRAARAAIMASDMKLPEKLQYTAMAETATIVLDITGDSFQKVKDVTIPAEVIAAAKSEDK